MPSKMERPSVAVNFSRQLPAVGVRSARLLGHGEPARKFKPPASFRRKRALTVPYGIHLVNLWHQDGRVSNCRNFPRRKPIADSFEPITSSSSPVQIRIQQILQVLLLARTWLRFSEFR